MHKYFIDDVLTHEQAKEVLYLMKAAGFEEYNDIDKLIEFISKSPNPHFIIGFTNNQTITMWYRIRQNLYKTGANINKYKGMPLDLEEFKTIIKKRIPYLKLKLV